MSLGRNCFIPLLAALVLVGLRPARADLELHAPSATQPAAPDYATEVLGDPWDMDSSTDLAAYVDAADYAGFSEFGVAGGVLRAKIASPGAYFYLLSPAFCDANPEGKTGQRFPIDSKRYRYLVVRMHSDAASDLRVLANRSCNYFGNFWQSIGIATHVGWHTYVIDLETVAHQTAVGGDFSWSSQPITGLRIDPGVQAGVTVHIDWIMLAGAPPAPTGAVSVRHSPSTSSENYTIYADTDTDLSNGVSQVLVSSESGDSSFAPSTLGLFPGTYRVIGVAGSTVSVAPESLRVNTPPSFTLFQPDDRGGDDFAASALQNPWNMDDGTDVYAPVNVQGAAVYPNSNIGGERGNYFAGTSTSGNHDPYQHSLFPGATPGAIDARRYKNLVFRLNVGRTQDIVNGSVARIVWRKEGTDTALNSDDIIIRNGWQEYRLDMQHIWLEPLQHPNTPSDAWGGLIDLFRVDPHEFSQATSYAFDYIRVTADDEADKKFVFAFDFDDPDSTRAELSATFYAAAEQSGLGNPVGTVRGDANTGVFVWDTVGVPAGSYRITAVISDGKNSYMREASGRITVDHGRAQNTFAPVITLDSPQPGEMVYDTTMLSGWAVDDIQIAAVEVKIDGRYIRSVYPGKFHPGARTQFPQFAESGNAGFHDQISWSNFGAGLHRLEVCAFDTAGNRTCAPEITVTRINGVDPSPHELLVGVEEPPLSLAPPQTRKRLTLSVKVEKPRRRVFSARIRGAKQCATVQLYATSLRRKPGTWQTTLIWQGAGGRNREVRIDGRRRKLSGSVSLQAACDGSIASPIEIVRL